MPVLHTHETWVYLAASPLTWLTLTLVAFQAGLWLHRRCRHNPIVNPVLLAIAFVSVVLAATGTDYQAYFNGAQYVHFLLGTATVALAVPLARQFAHIRRSWLALTVGLLAGSATAAGSAVGIAWLLGASKTTILSLAPKSVTAPVAMGIAEKIGGEATLTAVLVILTGIVGAVFGTTALQLVRVRNPKAIGFALGVASHGLGTARALHVGEVAGAFSGLAMGLNALATALLLPICYALLS
ncbi:LrgB family protein [Defluviicoccus vanus]|uniref:LrgB family protein n=1 Tax=Defluviicoccus vanus TaxID=111831 RepID=A0A7H1N4H0_9PROT|nr:LrgB family protein [Defluviicoccus vanus]QNT70606.1 LrgB family protein [Defluviicoccus vanus]